MMKLKTLILIIITLNVVISSSAQQQIENPGFEEWEEFGIGPDTLEPVNWSSLKSSDGGDLINMVIPQVWEQSTDAHSGMYSIKLINMPILTLVAPGTLTNGRVHAALPPTDAYVYTIEEDPQWHTTFTEMPDSLIVWAKYFPQQNDIGHVMAVLHTDTAKIFDTTMTNWVAVANIEVTQEMGDWTRLSVPFTYLNGETPEFLLMGIFVGDAVNATIGSIMYLDDFELIYYNTAIENKTASKTDIYFSSDKLVVNMDQEKIDKNSTLEILDLSGRLITSRQFIMERSNNFLIDIPAGIYICRISNSSFEFTQKIVKK